MLVRDIDFRFGGINDKLGATGTVTGSTFKNTEKGIAIETGLNKYVTYNQQLLPNGAFSVVVWARLKYTHKNANDRAPILASVTIGVNNNISLCYPAAQYPMLWLGENNFKYFIWPLDKRYHCFIFTCVGSAQTDINSAAFYVDTVVKAAGSITASGAQGVRAGFIYTGGGNHATGGNMISRLKIYDHVLSSTEIAKEQIEFENSKPYVNNPFKNVTLPNGNQLVLHETWKGYGVNTAPKNWVKISGSYLIKQLITDSGIKKKGQFVNRCATAGVIGIPNSSLPGTTILQVYKGADANVSDYIFGSVLNTATTANQNGYVIRFGSDEKFYLYKSVNGTLTALITSASTYSLSTYYELKLTRTTLGVFTLYLLVNGVYTSLGTATDTTFSSCKWFCKDLDAVDECGEIKFYNLV